MKVEDAGHDDLLSSGQANRHENGGSEMVMLSRKHSEAVVVGRSNGVERLLKVTVLKIVGGSVLLGFEAGEDFPIHSWEMWERIRSGDSSNEDSIT